MTLLDGQDWHVPRPVVVFTPADGTESGFAETLRTDDPGGRYMELIRARRDAVGDYNFIKAEVELGKYLLQWNYDLTDDEVGALAPFAYPDADDEDDDPSWTDEERTLYKIREEIMKVARGASPKRPPAGTGSSGTPAAPPR